MERSDRVSSLKGVGTKTAALLEKLNIVTVEDLLNHFPRDYESFSPVVPLSDCKEEGAVIAVSGILTSPATIFRKGSMSMLNATLKDGSGSIRLTWFHANYLKNSLKVGVPMIARGRLRLIGNRKCMDQPQIFTPEQYEELSGHLRPRYALTEGVTDNLLMKLLGQILMGENAMTFPDDMPNSLRLRLSLCEKNYAVKNIHFPENADALKKARTRLVFEEFLAFLIRIRCLKDDQSLLPNRFPLLSTDLSNRIKTELPYDLTGDQENVLNEILADMKGPHPMNRLVQGDVGSGKTILAFLSMVCARESGYQSALMAPTEVLARQHFSNMSKLLIPYGLENEVVLLVGSMTEKQKRIAREKLSSGEARFAIGTHALLQDSVRFSSLGLVITDEQHRFGVNQRSRLTSENETGKPHTLVMSATPIPRTLAVILYGDLDLSLIKEKPKGRVPIHSCVVGEEYRPNTYRLMDREIRKGRQVLVICPMVEDNPEINATNVEDTCEKVRDALPGVRTEILHGRMKADEKDRIMNDFASGKIQILVSTTVVEVGVDVPNTTLILIENAERFGLAQLHQLRGRVGRGSYESYCVFMTGEGAEHRKDKLSILTKSSDGFEIAEEDLRQRGPGELFGIRQSGELDFGLGDIMNDHETLLLASKEAERLLKTGGEDAQETEYLQVLRNHIGGDIIPVL